MDQKRTQWWVFGATLVVLAVFQAWVVFSWPGGIPWGGLVLCLLCDGALVGFFAWIEARNQGDSEARAQQLQGSLGLLLDQTKAQQLRWVSLLEGVDDLPPSEREALRNHREALGLLESSKADPSPSMIDTVQTLLLVNHHLLRSFDDALALVPSLYERLRTQGLQIRLNHFRLHESFRFLAAMGAETSGYAEKIVLDVLASFREITQFSHGIGTDVMGKMRHLMDPQNSQGLDAINKESSRLLTSMDEFFLELSRTNEFTEKAVHTNLEQMQRVQTMAQAIGDFSESIRMISLNLNIEAARSSQQGTRNGKAFQVLAAKLSEFASKAQELSHQQEEIITVASSVMTEAGEVQTQQLSNLMVRVSPIKGRLEPFAQIVTRAFCDFEAVESSMASLSSAIEEKLKGVLGQFQFQDVVRQEQEHILAMFAHIRDRAEEGIGDQGSLDETHKQAAREDLITTFENMASTENERALIQAERRNNPELGPDTEAPDLKAGSVALF